MSSIGFKRFSTTCHHVNPVASESLRQALQPAGGIHMIDVAGGSAALPAWSAFAHRRTSHWQSDAATGLRFTPVPPGTNVKLAAIHRHATNALALTSFVRIWGVRPAGTNNENLLASPLLDLGLTSGGPLVLDHSVTNPPSDLVPVLPTPPSERFVDEINIVEDLTLQPGAEILGGTGIGGISHVVFDPCGATHLLIAARCGTAEGVAILIGGV